MAVAFLSCLHFLSLVLLLFGCHKFEFNVLISGALLAFTVLARRRKHPHLVPAALIFAAILATGLLLSAMVIDVSYDGVRYHTAGALAILDSYNFLVERYPHSELGLQYASWIGIYPKLLWVLGANFFAATGHFETAKTANWLGLLITFGSALPLFLRIGIHRPRSYLLAGLLAVNPIAVSQLLSFEQDGLEASLLLSLACLLVLQVIHPSRTNSLVLSLLALLIINQKTTGVVFVTIFFGAALVWSALSKASLRPHIAPLLAIPVGFFLVGYAPFTQSLLETGNPFQGVLGPGAEKFEPLPPHLLARNRLVLFGASLFGRTARAPQKIELKIPGAVTFAEVREISDTSRFGAFGPLISLAFLLAAVGFVAAMIKTPEIRAAATWSLFTLLAATFIHPAAWWLRYVPHFFLIPFLFLAIGSIPRLTEGKQWIYALSRVICFTLIANIALFAYPLARSVVLSEKMRADLAVLCRRASEGRMVIYDRHCWNVKGPVLIRAKVHVESGKEPPESAKVEELAGVVFSIE